MHKLHELKEKLMDELESFADMKSLSRENVETIKYAASAIDHICNIMEDMDEGYSDAMGRHYPMEGTSYARGRGYRGRRGANQYGSYAMDRYSRTSDGLIMELKDLMKDAPDERTRQEMHNLVQRLEQM